MVKSILIVFFALVSAGLSCFAWHEHQELVRLRQALIFEARYVKKRRPLATKQADHKNATITDATSANKSIRSENSSLNGSITLPAPQKLQGDSFLTSTNLSTQHRMANSASAEGDSTNPIDGWLAMMDDPEYQHLTDEQQRAKIATHYGSLFQSLGLSDSQKTQLTDLLIQKRNTTTDLITSSLDQGTNPYADPDAFQAMVASSNADIDNQIKQLLGETGYTQLSAFNQYQAIINTTSKLQTISSSNGNSLSADQLQLFQRLLAENGTSRITPEITEQANGFLTAPQIQALQSMQQQQQIAAQRRNIIQRYQRAAGPLPSPEAH